MRAATVVLWCGLSGCSGASAELGDRLYTRIACDDGLADCDARLSTGCETRTASDPAHCGACGHACARGETCASGRCEPAPSPPPEAPGE